MSPWVKPMSCSQSHFSSGIQKASPLFSELASPHGLQMQPVYPLALVALGSWLHFLTGAAFLCEAIQCLHVPNMGVCIYVPMQHCLYMCLLAWFMAVCCFFGILCSNNLGQARQKSTNTANTKMHGTYTHICFKKFNKPFEGLQDKAIESFKKKPRKAYHTQPL